MNEHHIQTPRTARYFTLGELNNSTENVWIVLHGYAQLAKDFIQTFEVINNGKNFIVAPEALNRFYSSRTPRTPVATWMTSEDRLNEIEDYIKYLDNLYLHLKFEQQKSKIIVLGFSQGTSTASRWVHATKNRVDHFVIYSGEIAFELISPLSEKIKTIDKTYVTGKKDPLISREEHLKVYELMKFCNADIIDFDGGHEVLADVIKQLAEKITETGSKSKAQLESPKSIL